jgi:hypothetical protein
MIYEGPKMKQLKYKLYACSYGSILLYEDGTVEFIPMLSITVNETLAMSELDDLDFDNNEVCEFLDEDIEEFEEDEEIHSTEDVLKKILETPEEDL